MMIERAWVEFGKFIMAWSILHLTGLGLGFLAKKIRAKILSKKETPK